SDLYCRHAIDERQIEKHFSSYLNKPIKQSQLFNTLNHIFYDDPTKIQYSEPTKKEIDDQLGEKLPLKILVAEDNVVNQKLAMHLLKRMGYRADFVANGLEVLEAVSRQSYDVILMDVQMPEMDGLTTTQEISRRYSAAQRPRIIAVTANAMQEDREQCLRAGMDDYISKPIQVNTLIQALNRCVPLVTKSSLSTPELSTHDEILQLAQQANTYPEQDSITSTDLLKIDYDALKNVIDAMGVSLDEYLPTLLGIFLDEAKKLIDTMQSAVSKQDGSKLAFAAHTLKSSSAALGIIEISESCQKLETMGSAGELVQARTLVSTVQDLYQRVEPTFSQYMQG
ncbi:MAG: response regulator, partial [Cyanothece sp. SIO2G6]|nr:response regulator [Cyanothece sp. SIO2G6]